MKITLKLFLVVLASTALVLSVDGYLRVRREMMSFQSDMVDDIQTLGRVLERLLADAWQTYGQQRVVQLIADANASNDRIHFRWIGLENTADAAKHLHLNDDQITQVLKGEAVTAMARGAQGPPALVQYVPIQAKNGMPGVVELSESLATIRTNARASVVRTVQLGVVLVGISGCFLLIIGVVMIGSPMRRVIEKTRRVGNGELDGPLHFRSHDEFAEVAAALNHMCDQLKSLQATAQAEMVARIETLEQLRHADRLKTVGSLASGLAHELGTPLNVVSGRANLIESGQLNLDDISNSARIIKEQVQRMSTIIRRVLDFARRKSPQRTSVDLRALAQQTLGMLTPLAQQHQAVLVFTSSDKPIRTSVDPEQIGQVLVNLVTNAWQAMPQGGEIDVVVSTQSVRPPVGLNLPDDRYACLTIADQGGGIQDEDLAQIFNPFFTTKDMGTGTGLGLSITYGIVHDHNGWIDVANRPKAGACFSIYLPLEEERCLDAS